MDLEGFLSRLEHARRNGAGWIARCPAHEDNNPSLSLDERDAKILLHCHAGCSVEAICKALGIEVRELFTEAKPQSRIVNTYDYRDERGAVLFQAVRYEPKEFKQRRPDGHGGWIWNLNGTRRVLYGLPEVLKAKSVLICEGEKDVETARKLGLVATCNPSGAGKWRDEYSESLRGKRDVIIADADEPGRKHAQQVAESLRGKVESLKTIELPGAKDLSEWVEKGGTRDALLELIRNSPESRGVQVESEPSGAGASLISVSIAELLKREIKRREMLLDPILPEQGLAMLYAYRGIGKTFIALGIAAAIASGGRFLRWTAPRARRVLYLDGELPAKTMQERSAMVLAGIEGDGPDPDALRIITPDFQKRPIPDLSTLEGQKLIEPHLDGIDLLVLDNLSALCRYGNENEGESWLPVQAWGLALRRRGISVLFIHHAGKNKSQRGTSRREDLLDTVITLKHPADYNPSQGLRCEVHFEKTRGMLAEGAKPFEVRLGSGEDGRAVWTLRDLETAKAAQAAELFVTGMSVRDVAEELGISRSTAHRLRKLWQASGIPEVSQRPDPIGVGQWDS